MSSVLLKNIGTIVSGDITAPILEGNAIFVEGGKIQKVGNESGLNVSDPDLTIDCVGTTVTPGLFDSHCHVVLGDYTPRQKQTGFLESEVHGGVTKSRQMPVPAPVRVNVAGLQYPRVQCARVHRLPPFCNALSLA